MRFTINLATRTYLDHRLLNRIIAAVIAILLAGLVWSVVHLSWDFGDLRRLKADIISYETRLKSRPAGVSEGDYNRMLADIRFGNTLIEQKSHDWLGLLDRLESATPDGIAVTSLVPEKGGELKIDGRTRSFAQVRSYLEKLEDSKAFTNILLRSHRDVVLGDRNRGVEFSITCRAVRP